MGIREFFLGSLKKTEFIEPHTTNFIASLQKSGAVLIDTAKPLGQKSDSQDKRVQKSELEACYRSEPNVFNAINKTTQLIMAAGYNIIGSEESVAFFDKFFSSINTKGGEMDWKEMLSSIYKHQMVYGESWIEKIPAKRDKTKIVDLQLLDPKKMDYARDSGQKIVLDVYGEPVGYAEAMPFDYTVENIVPPKEVYLNNQIFFPREKIAHFKLYAIGDGFYPIGLIEPSYKTIVRKLNMEEALANAVNRTGFPRMWAKIGNENHEPTEEQLQRTAEKIKNMDYMGVITYPYYMETGILEARRPERLQEHLDYYIQQIVTGTGLPQALATGSGETTNRSTLNRQEALSKLTLKDIIRRTVGILEQQIIKPIALSNNIEPVKIVWGEISIEELDGKAKRLKSHVDAGLLTPDLQIETVIRRLEDLPIMSKETLEKIKSKPKQKPKSVKEPEKDDDDKSEDEDDDEDEE